MSFSKIMLGLIHNIRVDRIRKDHSHSFKKNLNNYTNSELSIQKKRPERKLSSFKLLVRVVQKTIKP